MGSDKKPITKTKIIYSNEFIKVLSTNRPKVLLSHNETLSYKPQNFVGPKFCGRFASSNL